MRKGRKEKRPSVEGLSRNLYYTQERVRDLEAALFALAGDVEAFHVSCTCQPPVTDKERENLARAKEILHGYEPVE